MLGLRWTTKRELALFSATLDDLRARIRSLEEAVERERKRADAAVNALLARTQNLVLTPHENSPQEIDQIQKSIYDLFGDAEEQQQALKREAEFMEKLQS